MKKHLLEMTIPQVHELAAALGEPAFRARQLAEWVWRKQAGSFSRMSDLPADLRRRLEDTCRILACRLADRTEAADGTVKCLLELPDGEHVEAVAIPDRRRLTACLSTQVGCAMGCAFCATGLGGLRRNLTAGEIVEQVFHLQAAAGGRVTHVVFMGMGEPLANYDATVGALRALIDPQRMGISARRVTVSTVGLPKAIRRLAGERLPVTLAISLHAPDDALRRRLVPAAARHSLAEVLAAAEAFYQARHREVTLEYVLLAGVNDSWACADGLIEIARRLRCNVNLIRYNPTGSAMFERPGAAAAHGFADRLRRRGVNVHLRRSRGLGASAACGQLRQRTEAESRK